MTKSPPAAPPQQRQELITAATAGNAHAQSRLGDIYREGGTLTEHDYGEAMRWYQLAAAQGDANAANNIGAMHEHALGVPENMVEAAQWYRRAADRGLDTAQYNLALLLGFGIGVPMDEPEATALLHKAAAQGYIPACTLLGTLYRHGDYVEKRIPIAAEMHVIAALEGNSDALAALAEYHGEIEAEALGGSLSAAVSMAKMHDRGLGVELDKAKMLSWLLWADECPTRDDEIDVREEQDDMRGFYGMTLSDDVKDEAWALLNRMRAANPRADGTNSKRRRRPSVRRKQIAKRVAGGS